MLSLCASFNTVKKESIHLLGVIMKLALFHLKAAEVYVCNICRPLLAHTARIAIHIGSAGCMAV